MLLLGCASSEPAVVTRVGEQMRGSQQRVWTSDLKLVCDPTDAEVSLDGIPRGTCEDFAGNPTGLNLPEGLHKVEVKKSGFWPYESYVDSSGARAALTVKLSPHSKEHVP